MGSVTGRPELSSNLGVSRGETKGRGGGARLSVSLFVCCVTGVHSIALASSELTL